MTGRVLLRLGLIAALAAALIAAAIEVGRNGDDDATVRSIARDVGAVDPHRQALKRCQDLGEVAIHDATCLRAWAESRRRFLRIETPASRKEMSSQREPANTAPSSAVPSEPNISAATDPIGKLILDTESRGAP
jgi:conjugative transfer region protein TrbK